MKPRESITNDRAAVGKIVSMEGQRYNTIIRDASKSDPAPIPVKLAVLHALVQEMSFMMLDAIKDK